MSKFQCNLIMHPCLGCELKPTSSCYSGTWCWCASLDDCTFSAPLLVEMMTRVGQEVPHVMKCMAMKELEVKIMMQLNVTNADFEFICACNVHAGAKLLIALCTDLME